MPRLTPPTKGYDYLKDPILQTLYEFHLHDVICCNCGICNSGSHDWTKIPHSEDCKKGKHIGARPKWQTSS